MKENLQTLLVFIIYFPQASQPLVLDWVALVTFTPILISSGDMIAMFMG